MHFNLKVFKFSLLIIFSLSVFAIILLHNENIIQSWILAVLYTAFILVDIWFICLLFIPREFGKVKYRRVTVGIIVFLATTASTQTKIYEKIPKDLLYKLNHFFQLTGQKALTTQTVFVLLMLFLLALILCFVNYLLQDKTIMKEHKDDFDQNFPERDFNDRLKSFCNFLKNRIDLFDNEANWSDAHFTALNAEVETLRGKENKITNLVKAIKSNYRSKVFLVLGEPGSGKSVALRKLCRDLIAEVLDTRKIPIYVNLKEWTVDSKWSEVNQPTPDDLYKFCLGFLKNKDIFADDFINKYFKRLYENGHLFFIIDSFDEIPSVLDVDESSLLIDKLSEILYNFLGGAHESRGVLASRYFRKPTSKFQADTTLNVRPFSHYKINEALNKYIPLNKNIIKIIFKERTDLLPIASNPFAVGLIYSYIKDNDNQLPNNQADLFSSYINNRLEICKILIQKNSLTKSIIINYAIEIAAFMLSKTTLGLEASLDELKKRFREVDIESIIDILVYARIARIGRGEEKRFSFVHRRFNEYFVIQKYLLDPTLIELESIPNDSRFRDALVLYCEIAPEDMAIAIADFCWKEVSQINVDNILQLKRSIHCLRFLIEAYRLRINCLNSFKEELSTLIVELIKNYNSSRHPLITKIATEATGILDQAYMQEALLLCFNINNWWINQTAIQSCRYLNKIDKVLKHKIMVCIARLDYLKFLNQKNELLFTLSISESFNSILLYAQLKTLDIYIFIALLIVTFIKNPALGLINLLFFFVFRFLLIGEMSSVKKLPITSVFFESENALRFLLFPIFFLSGISLAKNYYSYMSIIDILTIFGSIDKKYEAHIFFEILILFVLPILDMFIITLRVFDDFSLSKKLLRQMIVLVFAMILLGTTLYLILPYILKYNLIKLLAVYTTLGLISLAIFLLVVQHISDYLSYQKLNVSQKNISRIKIAEHYKSFKTEYFKNKFVTNLRSTVNTPRDSWPVDFSLIGNDKSLILLTQLDEKWLGLA
ncbi:MAG: NACHT domain-containing protein [Janthinobacterium lividum]